MGCRAHPRRNNLNMDRNLSGAEAGLVGLWNFNEGSGTVVADRTSNGNDGAITGPVTWSTDTYTFDGANNEKWHFPARIDLPTYDGSGQMVHPSVVYKDAGFGGYKWWMAMTPYAGGDDQLENPSILASNNGVNWVVPAGVVNPLIATPAGLSDINSDPCLLFVNDGGTQTLWLYYRETVSSIDRIYRITSTDGVTWTSPVLMWTIAASTAALSIWVFWSGSEYVALWVDSPSLTISRRTSPYGITWSAGSSVTVAGIPAGRNAWHLEGVKDPSSSRYHIMFCSSTGAGGASARLHYAYSDDECVTMTVVNYLMADTYGGLTNEYKSSIVPDPVYRDRYRIYGGHRNAAGEWWRSLVQRKYISGDMYQEQALP